MNKLKIRETMVSVDRLPIWFEAVQASKHRTVRDLLLFLLFTGTRSKSEAFKLKWSDIDWEGRIIYFHDTKNSTTLKLPMSGYIYELLQKRLPSEEIVLPVTAKQKKTNTKSAEYVFPSQKAEEGHVTDVRKEVAKISKTAGFRISPHDLRRTFLTYAGGNAPEMRGHGKSNALYLKEIRKNKTAPVRLAFFGIRLSGGTSPLGSHLAA